VSRGRSTLGVLALLGAGIAGGVGLASRQQNESPANLRTALELQASFNRAADIAMRSVVHITQKGDGFQSDNVGSGIIVTKEGHIVTNGHVVGQGKQCQVRFVDGSEYSGKVVGEDHESDIAVVKIEAPGAALAPMEFGDSDRVRVGDIVFAIGSPYGYNHTVTSGIVSAKHRRIEEGKPYEDYLQTDAAINPGNSGGALVNLEGKLVGLNTAMVSQTRAGQGIGLAIASKLVKWVQERLIRDGVVKRGYLGIVPLDLDMGMIERARLRDVPPFQGVRTQEELLKRLGLTEATGVLLGSVVSESPADRAGLQYCDVLVEFDGKPLKGRHELFFRVAEIAPGAKVKVKFRRGGKEQGAEVVLAERPSMRQSRPVDPTYPYHIPK